MIDPNATTRLLDDRSELPDPHLPAALRRLARPWVGSLVLALTAAAMLIWTWGTWCDPITGFGKEIYVAWRLAAGDVLYRDIDYFNGPVSPYLNSLLFRLFGASLLTLQLANLFWWTLLVAIAHRLFAAISDRLAAFVAIFLFITLFSFLQFTDLASYNFVCPYEHEATHSLVCAFGMLLCLHAYLRRGNTIALFGCGLLLGVMFLMKVEVTVAASAALAVGVGLDWWTKGAGWKGLRTILILMVTASVPIAVAFLLLRLAMPNHQAWGGVLGAWKYLGDKRITGNRYFRWVAGTDAVANNLTAMFRTFAVESLVLGAAAIVALVCRRTRGIEGKIVTALSAAAVVLMLVVIASDQFNWQYAMRPLNLIAALTVLGLGIGVVTRRRQQVTPRLIMQLTFGVFALVMLARVFFNVVIFRYGFTLAVPAFALMVMLMVSWIPQQLIARFHGTAWVLRAVVIALLGSLLFEYVQANRRHFGAETIHSLGSGADRFTFHGRNGMIGAMVHVVSRDVSAKQTVACLPQGAMINYLTRRVNGTGELTLMPVEFFTFGNERIMDRFRAHPPDWIVTVPSDTRAFGFERFGRDYAQDLFAWIATHYREVTPDQVKDPDFFMHLLRYDPAYATTRPAFSQR